MQPEPEGLAQAVHIAADLLDQPTALVPPRTVDATVFDCSASDAIAHGIVELDGDGCAISIEVKPKKEMPSDMAVTGYISTTIRS